MRDHARKETTNFVEIYVKCPVEVCIQRDVKGMYQKALRGRSRNSPGVSDPYEEPANAEIVIETDKETLDESVQKVLGASASSGFCERSVAYFGLTDPTTLL